MLTITESAHGKSFTFGQNLPSAPPAGAHMLIATQDFADIPGAPKPDYILPNDFLSTNSGDTITYGGGIDHLTYTDNQLPTDGIHSLARIIYGNAALTTQVNSPTNFAGRTGGVPEPAAAGSLAVIALAALLRRR